MDEDYHVANTSDLDFYFRSNASELNATSRPSGIFELDTDYKRSLKLSHDIVCFFIAGAAMLAIGCDISINKVKEHLKKPKSPLLGLTGQFILMPLVGFTVVNILNMDPLNGAGVIILCCAPGGGYSNLLSYLTKSDVSLSALMTTLSSVLSLGLTPLNLWIYGRFLEQMNVIMPYEKILISLVILQVILGLGIVIRYKFGVVADFITKIGVVISVLMLIARQAISIMIKPNFYQELHWKIYAACFTIFGTGLIVPYFVALLFRSDHKVARTLAIETAIQSIGTSFTIVFVSFNIEVIWEVQQYIGLYSDVTCTGFLGLIMCYYGISQLIERCQRDKKLSGTSAKWMIVDNKEVI